MPIFITQGRFSPNAFRGMLAKPDDRAETVGKLFAQSGGKLLAYYMTFGQYDFLVVSEGPLEGVPISSIIASASGDLTDLTTTLAISSTEMKDAFAKAGPVVAGFRPPGQSG